MNAITYKKVFPLIKDNKVRLGYNHIKMFCTGGIGLQPIDSVVWYSTYPVSGKPTLTLTKTYDPDKYPRYDNYDAIEVSRVKDIPYDYFGTMGVPVTILNYCLDDIEIVGNADSGVVPEGWSGMSEEFVKLYYEQGNTGKYQVGNRLTHYAKDGIAVIPYNRILIRFKIIGGYNYSKDNDGHTWNAKIDGKYVYKRVLIRRKTKEE